MRLAVIVAATFLAGALAYSTACADIYVYVDADGVQHFTNTPTHGKYRWFMKEASGATRGMTRRGHYDPSRYDHLIRASCAKHGLDTALVKAVIKAESDFDQHAVSRKGAEGLMQLMPDTAQKFDVFDPFDPAQNIEAGVRHLKHLMERFDHDLKLCLAAYNAGETAVTEHGGIPNYSETKTYVSRVLNYYREYKTASSQVGTEL
jgi:soluble lytic murein transglycosylase